MDSDMSTADTVKQLSEQYMDKSIYDARSAILALYPNARLVPRFSVITADFKPDRLNVHYDDHGIIFDIYFG